MSMVVPTANNRFPIWQTVVVMMSINGFAVIFPLTIWQSISMQPLFSTRRDRQVSKEVQRCIYTTNWIERLNRKYKRTIYMRTSIPSTQAVIFLLGSVAMEETKNAYKKKIDQFKSWKNINENRKDKREE